LLWTIWLPAWSPVWSAIVNEDAGDEVGEDGGVALDSVVVAVVAAGVVGEGAPATVVVIAIARWNRWVTSSDGVASRPDETTRGEQDARMNVLSSRRPGVRYTATAGGRHGGTTGGNFYRVPASYVAKTDRR
jgi:hypothetical protein